MLCLVQVSNCKATDAEKPLSQGEKLLNAILRLKLKYMKDVSFSWNEMLFAMQKQMQGHRCLKCSFSVRESCLMQF